MNMLFADTMKKLREEKGLSQNEIANRMKSLNGCMLHAPLYPGGNQVTVFPTPR